MLSDDIYSKNTDNQITQDILFKYCGSLFHCETLKIYVKSYNVWAFHPLGDLEGFELRNCMLDFLVAKSSNKPESITKYILSTVYGTMTHEKSLLRACGCKK